MANETNFVGYMQVIEETNRDKCRVCKHSRYDHTQCPRKNKRPCVWIKDLDNPKPNLDCKCKNFVTNDNLEYLEQEYQKRG